MPVKKPIEVVERPDLRLEQQGPEVAHDRRGQHHRQQDDGRPEAMAAELLVDEQRETQADQNLQRDRPKHEMRGDLEVRPNILVGEDVDIIVDADEPGRGRQVGHQAGERQPDRPDQRKDVDREQQQHRRQDEKPGDRPIRQPPHPHGDRWRASARRLLRRCLLRDSSPSLPARLWTNRVSSAASAAEDGFLDRSRAMPRAVRKDPCLPA